MYINDIMHYDIIHLVSAVVLAFYCLMLCLTSLLSPLKVFIQWS